MRITCCIRQTPDTESVVKIAADGSSVDESGLKWILGPYDEYSMEAAVQLREGNSDNELTAITLGPTRAAEALRTCLAMGADKGVHVNTDGHETDDAVTVASALAKKIEELSPDIVMTSTKGSDSDRGNVGAMLSELLGYPYVGLVSDIQVEDGTVTVSRDVEGGFTETFELKLPAVVCAEQGVRGQPRYPSLMDIMKSKKKPVETVAFADLGLENHSFVTIESLEYPPERPPGQIIEGDSVEAKVDTLLLKLRDEAKVIDF